MWIDLHSWRWNRSRARLATLTLVAALAACRGSEQSGKTVGELGNGEFVYTCVNPNDGACDTGGAAVFPGCVLLGGQFEMSYDLQDTDVVDDEFDLFVYVESANQSFIAGNGSYRADRVGRAAMLAREDEQVVDIIHLRIVEADGIVVKYDSGAELSGPVVVQRGMTIAVDVFATATGCSPLGGGGPVTAVAQDPEIATAQGGERVQIRGVEVGPARVTVGMAGFETEIDVLVADGPARRKKPGELDDGASESSSDEGGSDSGGSDEGSSDSGGSDSGGSDTATGTGGGSTSGGSGV